MHRAGQSSRVYTDIAVAVAADIREDHDDDIYLSSRQVLHSAGQSSRVYNDVAIADDDDDDSDDDDDDIHLSSKQVLQSSRVYNDVAIADDDDDDDSG